MNANEPWISIHGVTVPIKDVAEAGFGNLGTNERRALDFCKEWLRGRESFSITTSGSTGPPIRIEVRREAMVASAKNTAIALGLRPGMTALVCLDTGFIAGMMMLVRGMTTGMNMIITEPSSNPLHGIPPYRIDFAALVPYQLSTMLRSNDRDRVSTIGTIILGGATVSADLLTMIEELPAQCYATFGMTETLSHIALRKLNGPSKQDSFHALEGISLERDDRGCLVIRASYLREAVITNDLVEIIGPKEFKWLGRYDNVINSGGVKVIPEKVEKLIGDWMVARKVSNRFFVTGVAHPELGSEVTLVVEGMFSKEDEYALLTSLRSALGKYEVPRRVFYKEHFVETRTGKIDRKASLA